MICNWDKMIVNLARILSFVWVNSMAVIRKKLVLKLHYLFDENIAIMNLDNMHSTAAENARKCAQKLIGQKWTKYLFSYSISCFFVVVYVYYLYLWKTL